ncbi:MAG: holo-ACP synthase [Christensenellales bacterium]
MIIGTGIDIVEIERIKKLSQNNRFFTRVFSAGEMSLFEECRFRIETIAGRFACKEAVLKALGLGLCDIPLTNIEILKEQSGKPVAALCGAALDYAKSLDIKRIHISISHDGGLAIAFAVAEGD